MKYEIIKVLRVLFPFALTLFLWRMEHSFWNPGGILALIPIFYCSFVRTTPWFSSFSVVMCFLLDYNFSLPFYWTAMYCIAYAMHRFQDFIDLSQIDKNALGAFSIFFSITMMIFAFSNIGWTVLFKSIWCIIFASALYIPLTVLIDRVRK